MKSEIEEASEASEITDLMSTLSTSAEGGGRAEAYQLLDEDKMSHLVTPDDSPIGSVFVQMAAFR